MKDAKAEKEVSMKQLRSVLDKLQVPYTEETIHKMEQYREQILDWNEKVNLTAITDPEEFEMKHFVDSVLICGSDEWNSCSKIIDVGTGAGFPGMPLAILFPDKKFTLMDSLGKRIKILDEIAENIGINNVELIHARAEELAKKEYREQFDLCVSRAVANLTVLAEYCLPFVRVGGYFAPYKTKDARQEIKDSTKALNILGGSFVRSDASEVEEFDLDHQIFWIKKGKNTPSKYPRKAGTPSKEPLK